MNIAGATVEYGTSNSYGKSLTATNANTNYTMSEVTRTDVSNSSGLSGVTTVYYRVTKANYTTVTGTTTITISRVSVGAKPTTSVSKTYNTAEQTNNYTTPSYVNMTGNNKGTNVGSYVAKYTPDSNHKWSDNTYGEVSVTLSITPATFTVTATPGGGNYTGSAYTAKIKVSIAGTTVSYGTSASYGYSLTATNANTDYTMSSVSRTELGTTTVYYKVSKANYNDVTGTVNIVVGDTGVPVPVLTSTNNVAASQTVTLSATDNVGITGYYWGTSSTGGTYTSVTSATSWSTTKTVSDSGTYYLFVKDNAGNTANTSISFYKTTFSVTNGTVSPTSVVTKVGNAFTTPTVTPNTNYVSPGKWTYDTSSTVNMGASYTPAGNKTLSAVCSLNAFTLTANANNGTIAATTGWTVASGGATATKTVVYNSAYGTLPSVSRSNYLFWR